MTFYLANQLALRPKASQGSQLCGLCVCPSVCLSADFVVWNWTAIRLETISSRLEAIARLLEAIATRVCFVVWIRLETISSRLEAIARLLEAIATRVCY